MNNNMVERYNLDAISATFDAISPSMQEGLDEGWAWNEPDDFIYSDAFHQQVLTKSNQQPITIFMALPGNSARMQQTMSYDGRKFPICAPHDGSRGQLFRDFADDFITGISAVEMKDNRDLRSQRNRSRNRR